MKATPLLIVLAFGTSASAQLIVPFTVDQPPVFMVDAGQDVDYSPGVDLQGGATGGTGDYAYLWSPTIYLDDPTSPTPSVTGITTSTTFLLQATDNGLGCMKMDEVQVLFTIGVGELARPHFSISPNPTSEWIRWTTAEPVSEIRICSVDGALVRRVSDTTVGEHFLDISALSAGSYVLTVIFANGFTTTQELCIILGH